MSQNSSNVYLSELDLSQVVANAINSSGAMVFASSQGPLGPQLTTNTKQFVSMYGPPNPQVSYAHYGALAFLQQANQLWGNRVVGANPKWGGAVLQELTAGSSDLANYAMLNPTSFDPSAQINGSTAMSQNLAYLYAIGPGSYAGNVAVQISSLNMVQVSGIASTFPTVAQELSQTNQNLTLPTAVSLVATTNVSPLSGTTTVGGSAPSNNEYVLLTGQTTTSQNGVWQVNTSGAWTQATSVTIAANTAVSPAVLYQQTNASTNAWSSFTWTLGGVAVQNGDNALFIGQSTTTQNGLYSFSSATGAWTPVSPAPPQVVVAGQYLFNLVAGTYIQDTTFSGSALATGAYNYYITAVNSAGETIATAANITVSASNGFLVLTWNAVAGATSYNVYGRTLGSIGYLASVTTNSFTDYGTLVPTTTRTYPTSYAGTDTFTIEVFDLTVNPVTPVETFKVTLKNAINGYGQQTELSAVINNTTSGSKYIQAVNPAVGYSSVPLVYSTAQVALSGGSSGAAVTDSSIVTGWQAFLSKDTLAVNVLINGGYSTPAVQLAMDTVAQTRKDCTSILDMPSDQQTSAAAVSYRINSLNLNSNYSAIYTPDVQILDTYNGQIIYVPPSGYVAAQYAYTDAVASPALAPAGLNRGVLSILGVRVVYDQGDRDLLSANQVNYVRKMQGQGYAVMEAWTLQSKTSALSFVPVRRMLNVIETAMENALLYTLWEAEDPATEARIVGMLNDYLEAQKQAGNIQDYNVVSNSSDNPNNDLNQGILHVDVYILPTLPIQRIFLRTIVTKQGLSFQEAALLAA